MRRTHPGFGSSTWLCAVALGASLLGGCGSDLHSPDISVASVQPQVVCGSQLTTPVKVSGDGFTPLTVNTLADVTHLELPKVVLHENTSYGGTPTSSDIIVYDGADQNHVRWSSAQEMSFDVYPGMIVSDAKTGAPGMDLDPGLYDLSIQNPDNRRGTLGTILAVVALPQVDKVAPNPACDAQGTVTLTVTGRHFLQLNSDLPSVTFTSVAGSSQPVTATAATVADCTSLAAPAGITLSDCATLTVTLAQAALPPDSYRVMVTNPDSANCNSVEDPANPTADRLLIVPPPQVSAVSPDPTCDAQANATLTISGANFLQIDGALPQVTFNSIQGQMQVMQVTATSASNCTALPGPASSTVQSCSTLSVSLNQSALPPDDYQVIVTNPGAATCSSTEDPNNPSADHLVIVSPPTVTSSQNLAVCSQADTTLQLTGTNFLLLASPAAAPTLSANGMTFQTTVNPSSCVAAFPAYPMDAPNAQLCSVLSVTIPKGSLPIGSYPATLTNPGLNACSVSMSLQINVVGPPSIDPAMGPPNPQPNPLSLCTGGGTLKVTGENIYSGASVLIGGFPSTSISVSNTGAMVGGQPQQLATAQFSGPIPLTTAGNLADVTIQNAPGCSATLPKVESITPGPAILFVDPPAVPNIITIQATVYASGVSAPIKQIQVFPSGSNTPSLTFTTASTPPLVLDANFANRAYITLQAGALPAGKYDLLLNDQSVCPAFLPGALIVKSTPTLTVTSATPPFGATDQNTGIVIAGTGFVSVPRAYLSPSSGSGNAQSLSAVTFNSSTSLNAVVRAGLNPGQYDLVVVNPDGSFGIAKKAFTVTTTAAPPPIITSVAPASLVVSKATDVVVNGTGFRAGASITLTCYDNTNAVVPGSTATVSAVGSGGTTINATFTAASAAGGNTTQYCIVRVTNQDGTYFDYSAVGVTNASLNLTGFKAATNMTVGRRALSALAGRPTPVARFVYALGGDNGQDNAPFNTSEFAPTSLNGSLGTWGLLQQYQGGVGLAQAHSSLLFPKKLSFTGAAVVGRFVYVVGGFDGTAGSKAVYRAEILNPLTAPQFTDVNFNPGSPGLPQGVYIYRISAVFAAGDANNPSGESLGSDFFPIQIPSGAEGGVTVQLIWPTVAGAASYNIYRSPAVNAPAGSEKLMANVANVAGNSSQTYTDNGSVTPSGPSPLPLGSLGQWATMPSLASTRIGPAVGAAQDPATPGKWYLYAAGGNSGTVAAPTPQSTIELLPITITNSGNVQTQAVTTWTAATNKLLTARWAAAGLPATAATSSLISPATATYLFVGGGSTTSLTTLSNGTDVALVQSGGQPGTVSDSGEKNLPRPGYGGELLNNQMMCFGGFGGGGVPTTGSVTATLASSTTMNNFNSLGGGVLTQPRALQGTAVESAFIYQLGGANVSVNSAQSTTEQTIW